MRKAGLIAICATLLCGCDRQLDLYLHSTPLLAVESNWVPSLDAADMSGRATGRFYRENGTVSTEFFDTPNRVTAKVTAGKYGVLIFNGLMFAENNTNLEHIYFRNTDRAETFEAVVEQAATNRRAARADDDYLASNEMELFTAAWKEVRIADGSGYYRKYRNGEDCPGVPEDGEEVVQMVPRPLSYRARVVVHLTNPGSVWTANSALRGFVGSVFPAAGLPSHMRVTHRLTLNNLRMDENAPAGVKKGTIESPLFVTFGPPVDLAADDNSWSYELSLSLLLKDGSMSERTFDIRNQVLPVIEKIKNGEWYDPLLKPILIEIGPIELPDIASSVGVTPWVDDEIIRVPVTEINKE